MYTTPPYQQCLLGTGLIKFGQALLLTWGKSNVYYYSYFKHSQPDLPISYNTLPVALVALPVAIITVLSLPFAKLVGHSILIRIVTIVQCISLFSASYSTTYINFIFYYLVISSFCHSLTVYPVLACIWSHFPNSQGTVMGYILGLFPFAILFYITLITFICNPDNKEANLQIPGAEYKYFDYEVAQNIPFTVMIVSLISSISMVIGSWLVTYSPEHQQQQEPLIINSEIELPVLGQIAEMDNQGQGINAFRSRSEVLRAIKSSQFKTIFFAQFTLVFYLVLLELNFKSWSLTKINNDHYITLVDITSLVFAGLASFVWGYLADHMEYVTLFTWVYFASGVCGILFALSKGYIGFTVFYLADSMFDKGSSVVVGPGLIKVFGNDVGTQLLSFVSSGSLIALIISPLFQYIMSPFLTFDYILASAGIIILLAAYFNSRLQIQYESNAMF